MLAWRLGAVATQGRRYASAGVATSALVVPLPLPQQLERIAGDCVRQRHVGTSLVHCVPGGVNVIRAQDTSSPATKFVPPSPRIRSS